MIDGSPTPSKLSRRPATCPVTGNLPPTPILPPLLDPETAITNLLWSGVVLGGILSSLDGLIRHTEAKDKERLEAAGGKAEGKEKPGGLGGLLPEPWEASKRLSEQISKQSKPVEWPTPRHHNPDSEALRVARSKPMEQRESEAKG
jgi:hypothetical protein